MEINNIDMKMVIDILDSREARSKKQKELLRVYPCTLISFTLNTPGAIKTSDLYRKIHNEGMKYLLELLKDLKIPILNILTVEQTTGNEGFISINFDPIQTKKITVDIEEKHLLGRIFDFDVINLEHNQISRLNIGLKTRRCLLCDENALTCMRTKKHSYDELRNKVEEVGNKYFQLYERNL